MSSENDYTEDERESAFENQKAGKQSGPDDYSIVPDVDTENRQPPVAEDKAQNDAVASSDSSRYRPNHWGNHLLKNSLEPFKWTLSINGVEEKKVESDAEIESETQNIASSCQEVNYEEMCFYRDSRRSLSPERPRVLTYELGYSLGDYNVGHLRDAVRQIADRTARHAEAMAFVELENERLRLQFNPRPFITRSHHAHSAYVSTSVAADCEAIEWNIVEMEEIKERVETELAFLNQKLLVAQQYMHASLDPKLGQRGGFFITCDTNHQGSYVQYDPELTIFDENVEMSYGDFNFRCDAWVDEVGTYLHSQRERVVTFWPIKAPEEALNKSPIIGKRWWFKSARSIDDHPCNPAEKKERLKRELLEMRKAQKAQEAEERWRYRYRR
ncbi:uncharacterized protein PAC_00875 [Phialocephala subalpina]|uniref:Uncharacterized protein n=1 Tax=Phialocephala subalpina TaxID=576137 RepID=A0A1L7WDY8_9HELO|nr:uncharacterized protein PAC_00875 [Phialocephala subalpina]